ncbi:unnamed protein product, partial [Discosporangium mesarthrocarpum]
MDPDFGEEDMTVDLGTLREVEQEISEALHEGGLTSRVARSYEPPDLREARLMQEITRLKGKLDVSQDLSRPRSEGRKRQRSTPPRDPSPSPSDMHIEAGHSNFEDLSLHPLNLEVQQLRLQLDTEKGAREVEKQRHEVAMGEMESMNGKLRRQVKFLVEEEEEVRG